MDFLRAFTKYILTMAAALVALGLVIRVFYVKIVTVGDNSMAPTLLAGEEVVVWKLGAIEVGDVALCEKPVRRGAQEFVVARVVAQRGQQIGTTNSGSLIVSGRTWPTEIQRQVRFHDSRRRRDDTLWLGEEVLFGHTHSVLVHRTPPTTIHERESVSGFYLLGDNRTTSNDSRAYGAAVPERCIGRVVMRWSTVAATDIDDDIHRTHHAFDRIH